MCKAVINEVRYSILTVEEMVPYIDSAPPNISFVAEVENVS